MKFVTLAAAYLATVASAVKFNHFGGWKCPEYTEDMCFPTIDYRMSREDIAEAVQLPKLKVTSAGCPKKYEKVETCIKC